MRLIDADYLAKQLREQRVKLTGKLTEGINKGLNTAISIARNPDACSTIEAKPVVHGQWIESWVVGENMAGEQVPILIYCNCSACEGVEDVPTDYCPHCGAKMDGERKEI